jgi:hypothetical protein
VRMLHLGLLLLILAGAPIAGIVANAAPFWWAASWAFVLASTVGITYLAVRLDVLSPAERLLVKARPRGPKASRGRQ